MKITHRKTPMRGTKENPIKFDNAGLQKGVVVGIVSGLVTAVILLSGLLYVGLNF